MKTITYRSIGIIHSPFKSPRGTPIRAAGARDIDGSIEVFADYADGLEDLAGFSHIFLLYHFHLAGKCTMKVKPFLEDAFRGLFAARAPSRPNPIGISVVRLCGITATTLNVRGIDVVDGTPLLDIKPYIPAFDIQTVEKTGWIGEKAANVENTVDDGRFC